MPFYLWPETGDPEAVEYLVAWLPPERMFEQFPNLRIVFSIGAGVDQFDLTEFPAHIDLVKMLDPGITQGMVEYVLMAVLALHRQLPAYLEAQREKRWQPLAWTPASRRRVGILGLGTLGRAAAEQLRGVGFAVSAWSRSPHQVEGVLCYAGAATWSEFLGQCDILVCLLPLTDATRGLLCRDTFAQLPRGASLVSVGRGAHLVEEDLMEAMECGQVSAACIDVLNQEPPAHDHPLWSQPRVMLTPHVAASTQVDSGCTVLMENIRRHRLGLAIPGEVDRQPCQKRP